MKYTAQIHYRATVRVLVEAEADSVKEARGLILQGLYTGHASETERTGGYVIDRGSLTPLSGGH